jgi:ligand-binding SRPBCC domain-containing protein
MPAVVVTKHPQGGYLLRSECVVPRDIDEVFAFFSNAANLERLTPPWLKFQILTPQPIEMRPGRLIDYRLRIHGVPVRWQSEITAWNPPHGFADESRRGPYKYWRHNHTFEPCDGGTRVIDEAHYDVPGGALVHWLVVGRDVRKIFHYRQAVLAEIFPPLAARQGIEAPRQSAATC